MNWAIRAFLICFAFFLVYVEGGLPDRGDIGAPANLHVSTEYLKEAKSETGVPNVVSAVLADYRSYDTLGETIVIFTAGLVSFFILRKKGEDEGPI